MTVCGNKLSGVCSASCTFFNICRNNEIANLPKSNIEWMREASLEELAELFVGVARDGADALKRCNGSFEPLNIYKHEFWGEWLKQPHKED